MQVTLAPATDVPLIRVRGLSAIAAYETQQVLDDLGFKTTLARALYLHGAEDAAFLTTAKTRTRQSYEYKKAKKKKPGYPWPKSNSILALANALIKAWPTVKPFVKRCSFTDH